MGNVLCPPSTISTSANDEMKVDAHPVLPVLDGPLKTNSAFFFIKPHAVNDSVKSLVEQKFEECNITVKRRGQIDAETIDKDSLIDNHWHSIATKAMQDAPKDLVVQQEAQDSFKKLWGIEWSEALKQNLVYNSVDGAKKLNITLEELGERFTKLERGEAMLKFGGGFYCGKLDSIYVINGFYSSMRARFTQPGTCIFYYDVEWEAQKMSFQNFRAKVIGDTSPEEAQMHSIRSDIFMHWEDLELTSKPNQGNNGVHASASPFEAMIEKANWLGDNLQNDPIGASLVKAGMGLDAIRKWTADPPVMFDGHKQSLFDLLEDLDAQPCVDKAVKIYNSN